MSQHWFQNSILKIFKIKKEIIVEEEVGVEKVNLIIVWIVLIKVLKNFSNWVFKLSKNIKINTIRK